MKYTNGKNKGSGHKGAKVGKNVSIKDDPFFNSESKKRRKIDYDEDILSEDSGDDNEIKGDSGGSGAEEEEEDHELAAETPGEKRKRLAEEYVQKVRDIARRGKESEEEDDEDDEGSDDETDGVRDSRVAKILQQEQLEDSGRVKRIIASKVQKPESTDEFRILVKHRQSVTAVSLSEDDTRGFSAAKDGTILHWDVECGKGEKYVWPTNEVLKSHGVKNPDGKVSKHSRNVLALATSFDGRYLATGGLDRHIHIWDTRTRQHLQSFPGHRGPVSCLSFRQGSLELFSGSFDRTVKIWNVEDRAYITTLFGHQSEVLGIDCLRKERVLSVGRDRCLQLFKVPEESRLIFRAKASSLESCCFISNDEFLSGSDDGSVELWNLVRKKPVCIVQNAHPVLAASKDPKEDTVDLNNGHLENGSHNPESFHCSSAYSWVNSVSVCRNSDLAASGAGNGTVHLWSIDSEKKTFQSLYELPLSGFVNSLAFAKSGKFLIAGIGQEQRLGRWGRLPTAQNGVAIQTLKLT